MNKLVKKATVFLASVTASIALSGTGDALRAYAKPKVSKEERSRPKITLANFRRAANLVQEIFRTTTCDELPPKVDAQGRAIALRFRVKTEYPGYVAMFWDESHPEERATTVYYTFDGSFGPSKPPDWIVPSHNPLTYSYLWASGFFRAGTTELNLAQEDFQIDLPSPLTQTAAGYSHWKLRPNALAPRIAILLIPSIKAIGVDYPISGKPGTTFFPVGIWNYRRIEPCVHHENDRRWGK